MDQESLTTGKVEFGFHHFASEKVYKELNIDALAPVLFKVCMENAGAVYALDYACGTGMGMKIAHDYLLCTNRNEGSIIGLDPNHQSITDAQELFLNSPSGLNIDYIEGKSDKLEASEQYQDFFDIAFFLNAIHEFPDEETQFKALMAIAKSLKEGGRLVLNSTFIKEAYPKGSEFLWGKWKAYAQRKVNGTRVKTGSSFQLHSINYYADLIGKAGLRVESLDINQYDMPPSALSAIAEYLPFGYGVFSDFVPDPHEFYANPQNAYYYNIIKYKALVAAAQQLEIEHYKGKNADTPFTIPRNWATIVAIKD